MSGEKMRIAVDGVGGDRAPGEVIKASVDACEKYDTEIILLGPKELLEREMLNYGDVSNISIENASQIVSMDEKPTNVLHDFKDSAFFKGAELVKEGKADAFVSAGNTGAMLAVSTFVIGRIKGVERPAIATVVPSIKGDVIIIDAGANVTCKPSHLLQFALMGKIYAKNILSIEKPGIGLLSNGEEREKGTSLVKEAYTMISEKMPDDFYGNVEGRDIGIGTVDVVVTDGFSGNVVLKTMEGTAKLFTSTLKKTVMDSSFTTKIGALLMRKVFTELKKRFDYREYGGSFLVGVNGISVIAHGSSDALAIRNAIRIAMRGVEMDLVGKIKEGLEKEK